MFTHHVWISLALRRGHQIHTHLLRVESLGTQQAGKAWCEHLYASSNACLPIRHSPHSDTEANARQQVLIGQLREDSPAAMRVCAAEEKVRIEQGARHASKRNVVRVRFNVDGRLDRPCQIGGHINLAVANARLSRTDDSVEIRRFQSIWVVDTHVLRAEMGQLLDHQRSCATRANDRETGLFQKTLTGFAERQHLAVVRDACQTAIRVVEVLQPLSDALYVNLRFVAARQKQVSVQPVRRSERRTGSWTSGLRPCLP